MQELRPAGPLPERLGRGHRGVTEGEPDAGAAVGAPAGGKLDHFLVDFVESEPS